MLDAKSSLILLRLEAAKYAIYDNSIQRKHMKTSVS